MRQFKSLAVVILAVLSIILAANSYAADNKVAQGKAGPTAQEKFKKMDEGRQKMWADLNLTPEQKKQLEDNRAKNQSEMKAITENMKTARESLSAELMKPNMDISKINAIQSQIKMLQGKMLDNRLNVVLDVRKVLTPEQFTKFIDITNKRRSRQ